MVTRLPAGALAKAGPLAASIAAASFLLIATDLSAAVTVWTETVVRVYDTVDLSRPVRTRAMTAARDALVTASVDVMWIDCSENNACHAPPQPRELIVRLVNGRAPAGGKPVPLGDALVEAGEHKGVLATVYVDRVRRVAATTGTDEAVLLGRAIAHELGHLLMGSSTHARAGLMRAKWTAAEILRDRREDWIFSAADATLIARAGRRFDAGGVKQPVRSAISAVLPDVHRARSHPDAPGARMEESWPVDPHAPSGLLRAPSTAARLP